MKNHFILSAAILGCFAFDAHAQSVLSVGGSYEGNQVWEADTVKVVSNVTVSGSLVIRSASRVEFQGHYTIETHGFGAIGTSDRWILFTVRDTTGFSDFTSGAGGWGGITDNGTWAGDAYMLRYCRFEYGKRINDPYLYYKGLLKLGDNTDSIVIDHCEFAHNYAKDGAIIISDRPTVLDSCTINHNYSTAISLRMGDVRNCTVTNNTGDGVDVWEREYMISGNTITGNKGYGLYLYRSKKASVMNNVVSGNTLGVRLFEVKTAEFSDSISDKTVWEADTVKLTCDVSFGNELIIYPGTYVEFMGYYGLNTSSISAIGTAEDPITFTVHDTTGFSDANNTTGGWKGISINCYDYYANKNNNIDFCIVQFVKKISVVYNSAAITFRSAGKPLISNTRFENNLTNGLYFYKTASLIYKCKFLNNAGSGINFGGEINIIEESFFEKNLYGLQCDGGNITIIKSVFNWNTNDGIYLHEPACSKILGCLLQQNSGRGIYSMGHSDPDDKGIIEGNTILQNKGGGIYLADHKYTIINNVINDNQAERGGGIYITGSSSSLINNTICNNKAQYGGGLYIIAQHSSHSNIFNCIIRNNPTEIGKQLSGALDEDTIFRAGIYNCNIEGITAEDITGEYTNNIDADPQFIDGDNADFRLTNSSPCVNTGTADTTGLKLPLTDLDGNPRIVGPAVDMGVYEFQGNPPCFASVISVQDTLMGPLNWCADTVKITGDLYIDGQLVIYPGTYVEFMGHYSLTAGSVSAIGVAGDSITFTVHDTSGFSNPGIADGGWKKIAAKTVEFAFCKLLFGKNIDNSGTKWWEKKGLMRGSLTIKNSILSNNYSVDVFNESPLGSYAHFSDCLFDNNQFHMAYDHNAYLTISNSRFYGNNIRLASPKLKGCVFERNKSIDIDSNGDHGSKITDCSFLGNMKLDLTAHLGLSLTNSRIINNENLSMGGSYDTEDMYMVGNIICNNRLYSSFIIHENASQFYIINNTLCNNRVTNSTDAFITLSGLKPYFHNNIITGNGKNRPDGIQIHCKSSPREEIAPLFGSFINNLIEGGLDAIACKGINGIYEKNIDENPYFADTAASNYALLSNSPCINTGDSLLRIYYTSAVDVLGNKRIFGSDIDLGACEFQGIPVNRPPVIQDIRDQKMLSGCTKAISATFFDPDTGDICTFLAIVSDAVNIKIDSIQPEPASIRFIIAPDSGWKGEGQIQIRVSDNHGNIGIKNFQVFVSNSVCGHLTENTIWDADTIHVTCNITVSPGITLTILPGTVINVNPGCGFDVSGSLIAVGNEKAEITFTCSDTTGFYNNTHTGWGGIHNFGSSAISRFAYCNFCYARHIHSGGAMRLSQMDATISNCTFMHNYSGNHGGAIHIREDINEFKNNVFFDNHAKNCGGAIFNESQDLEIINNLFYNNYAWSGAAVYAVFGSTRIINSTIARNRAEQGGTGISIYNGDIINSIIWGNTSAAGGNQIIIQDKCNFFNSILQGGKDKITDNQFIGEYLSVFDEDPLLSDTLNHDFRLKINSPCINTGTANPSLVQLLTVDLGGYPRILDFNVDIGAYEYGPGQFKLLTQPQGKDLCLGSELALVSKAFGGVTGFQWQKEGTDIPLANDSILYVPFAETENTGNYNCIITAVDGVVSTDTVEVVVDIPATVVSHTGSFAACEGVDTLLVLQAAETHTINYSWLRNNSRLEGKDKPMLELLSLQPGNAGTYIGIAGNTCGSDTTSPIEVTVHPKPVIAPGGPYSSCAGDSIRLTPGDDFAGYWWNTGEILPVIIVTESGTYTVRVINEYQCENTGSTEVVFHPLPYVYLGEDTAIHTDDTLVLDAGEGFADYLWSTGNQDQILQVYDLAPGNYLYSIKVTDFNGCNGYDTTGVTVAKKTHLISLPGELTFMIYPVPGKDIIYLEPGSDYTHEVVIRITDITGQIVLEQKFEKLNGLVAYPLDISALPDGSYYLSVSNREMRKVERIVKLSVQ